MIRTFLVGLSIGLLLTGCQRSPQLSGDQHVVDEAQILDPTSIPRMDRLYQRLLQDTDVDFVIVTVSELKGKSISDYANSLFQRWKLGRRTRANRGVLLVMSREDRLVRLHTSYEMETLLTDAFISQVEHGMMAPYFEKNLPGPGLEVVAELVAGRIYEKILNKTFVPAQSGPETIGEFHAGGGGVENVMPSASSHTTASSTTNIEDYGAQPTADLAWKTFLRWNQRQERNVQIGLFDDKVRALFDRLPNAAYGQRRIADQFSRLPYEVRENGQRAAIVFPEDPQQLNRPWFFRKNAVGWQVDSDSFPEMIVHDQLNRWGFRYDDHPYHFAFKDYDIRPGRLAKRIHPRSSRAVDRNRT